jgi:hypothetical protein
MGIPQLPELGLETVPHQLWQLLLARAGHFCGRDAGGAAQAAATTSASAAATGDGGPAAVALALQKQGGGPRRQSFAVLAGRKSFF